ncbi:MAG: hypothetical protein ABIP95_10640 [Pelobium sp.]
MNKKRALISYILISIFLLANVIGDALYQISVAGYWSDRILFWIWFFCTFFILIKFWKKLLTKIYFGLLVAGVILSILPMMVPFWAIVLSSTGQGVHLKKQITPEYRVQVVGYSIMGRPLIEVIKNKSLLEKRIANTNRNVFVNDSTEIRIWAIKDAKFISETDSSIAIQFSDDILSGEMTIAKEINKK